MIVAVPSSISRTNTSMVSIFAGGFMPCADQLICTLFAVWQTFCTITPSYHSIIQNYYYIQASHSRDIYRLIRSLLSLPITVFFVAMVQRNFFINTSHHINKPISNFFNPFIGYGFIISYSILSSEFNKQYAIYNQTDVITILLFGCVSLFV